MENLKKNFGYQIAYRILAVITPLITSPIVSRALGAEMVGIYSATQAYANYFAIFAMLGVEYYGQRIISSVRTAEERQKLFWEIYFVQAISAISIIAIYYGSLLLQNRERIHIMVIQGLWVMSSFLDINWFFYGIEDFKLTVTRNFFIKVTTVLCILLFVREPGDLLLYTLIMSGSTAISQLVLWKALKKYVRFQKVNLVDIKKHILPIIRMFIPMIALSIYHNMDKTMLDLLSNEIEVGYYYSADKVINIPLGVICALGTVMLPRVSSILSSGTLESVTILLKRTSEAVMFLACAVGFGIGSIAEEFSPFFFGKGYEPVGIMIKAFVPVLIVKALSDAVKSQYLLPAQKDVQYTKAVVYGAVTNVIFNAALISKWGALGAIFGTFMAELVSLICQVWACKDEVNFFRLFLRNWYYLVAAVIMYALVRAVASMTTGVSVVIRLGFMILSGILMYLIICMLIWKVKKDSIFNEILKAHQYK